jgi:hypothetical protein
MSEAHLPQYESVQQLKALAVERRRAFGSALRNRLENFDPLAWSLFVAQRIRQVEVDPNHLYRLTPPFRLLNSIEACIAYARVGACAPITSPGVASVMNVYVDHEDHLQLALASKNLSLFAIALYREQIELQHQFGMDEIARNWQLFGAENPLPELSNRLRHAYGITALQWIHLCFAAFATTHNEPTGRLWAPNFARFAQDRFSTAGTEAFLRLSSRTPHQIRARFKRSREETHPTA